MPQLNPQVFQQLKGMMNQIKMAQNPQAMLNQMLLQNSGLKPAIDLIRSNNGNAQLAFLNLAKQMGVDPQMVLNQFK